MDFMSIQYRLFLYSDRVKCCILSSALIIFSVLFFTGCAFPLFEKDKDFTKNQFLKIEGIYECSNGIYKGITVIRRFKEIYHVHWQIGREVYSGVGIREGNMLSATWSNGKDINGIAVYKIESGPKLTGKYSATPGNGTMGREILTMKHELFQTPNDNSVKL